MVTNPLEKVVVEEVDALLESVEAIRKEVSSDYHAELDEIKQNLDHYVNSDTAPWPEYRASVPWGMIRIEFSARLQEMLPSEEEPQYRGTLYEKINDMLSDESFNPVELEGKEGINFIGDAKRVARLLDSRFPRHGLSVVETNHGGTVLNLGDKFQAVKTKSTRAGTKIYTTEQFNAVIREMTQDNPAFSQFLLESVKAVETFATEDFAALIFLHLHLPILQPPLPLLLPLLPLLRQPILLYCLMLFFKSSTKAYIFYRLM